MEKRIKIAEFPDGDGYWLLTWASEVVIREMDFLISVDLVQIDYEHYKLAPRFQTFLLKDESGGKQHFVARGVHVKLFHLLEIGSVWYKKERISSPKNSRVDRLTIPIISGKNVYLSRINLQIHRPNYFHPFDNSRQHGFSDCLVVERGNIDSNSDNFPKDIDKILIPPSELIRFYYCGSGRFVNEIFGQGIQHNRVYNLDMSSFNTETQEAYVRLRFKMNDNDASYIGRIAHSPFAHTKAIEIGKQIELQLVKYRRAFIRAWFPFETASKLRVTGKRVDIREKSGDVKKDAGFLVYTIDECSGEFPFKLLWHDRDNDARQRKDALKEEEKVLNVAGSQSDDRDHEIGSNGNVNQNIPMTQISVFEDAKFSRLPEVLKADKDHQKVRVKWKAVKVAAEELALGASENDPYGVTGYMPTTITQEILDSSLDFAGTSLIVERLIELSYRCQFLSPRYESTRSKNFQSFSFVDFKELVLAAEREGSWTKISTKKNSRTSKRQRKVVLIEIVDEDGGYFYYLEIEPGAGQSFSRVLISANNSKRPIGMSEFLFVLIRIAKAEGRWTKCNLSDLKLQKQAFNHMVDDTPEWVAERFDAYMRKVR